MKDMSTGDLAPDFASHREFLRRRFVLTVPTKEFTPEEVGRLEKYGHWFAALSEGHLKPNTPAQERFVECMRGNCDPESSDEQLWRRYRFEQLAQALLRALEEEPETADPNTRAHLFKLARAGSQIAQAWIEKHPPIPVKIPRGRSADRQAERSVRGSPWERMSVFGMRHLCGFGPTWHLHVISLLQDEQKR